MPVAAQAFAGTCAIALALAGGLAPPSRAAEPEQCPKVVLPAQWSAWGDTAMPASADHPLPVGKLQALALHRAVGDASTYEGSFPFVVTARGTFRFALANGSWIDVMRKGAALPSAAHGHGPRRSGIRKVVSFELDPGSYVVRIGKSPEAQVKLLIAGG